MARCAKRYVGRFAPSPTGPLHAGSLVAALASWLDARAHGGPLAGAHRGRRHAALRARRGPNASSRQLAACGLVPDEPPQWQSQRGALYQAALDRLVGARRWPIPAPARARTSSRRWPRRAGRARAARRAGLSRHLPRRPARTRRPRAWRLRVAPRRACTGTIAASGAQQQDVEREVGDFVLRRADGLWAYQLAVVVDDAEQGITARRARRGPGRQHGAPDPAAARAGPADAAATCTRRWCWRPTARSCPSRTARRRCDTAEPLRALNRGRGVLGLPAHGGPVRRRAGGVAARSGATPTICRVTEPGKTPPAASAARRACAHPRAIRSFVRRAGRTTAGQARAFEPNSGPRFLLPYRPQPLDLAAAFGRDAPTVLEIGFGMGEATAHIAALMPETNFLCCEVHEPGVGALLKRIGEQGLPNIRIVQHDAVEVLRPHGAAGQPGRRARVLPRPVAQARHNKRRLIQPPLVAKLASRLRSRRLHPLRDRLGAVRPADAGGAVGRAAAGKHGRRLRAEAVLPAADEVREPRPQAGPRRVGPGLPQALRRALAASLSRSAAGEGSG